MTISTIDSGPWFYTGDGVTKPFAYLNKIFAASDLKVYVDGALKTLTTDYTVSGVGSVGGGNASFVTAPASGAKVVIVSDVPPTQAAIIPSGGALPSAAIESAIDKAARLVQQAKASIGRTLRLADFDEPSVLGVLPNKATRAGLFLGFDAAGNPVASPGAAGSVAVSAYMATVLDDLTARAALSTLTALASGSRSISGGGTAAVTTADAGKVLIVDATAGGTTLAFDPAATLGAGFVVIVKKADTTSNQVILDPSGAELVDDLTTLTLPLPEDVAMIYCDGVKFHALDIARNWFIRSHRTNTVSPYTVNTFDNGYTTRNDATIGGITVNLPASSAVSKAYRGFTHVVQKVDGTSNVVIIDANLAETIDKALTKKLYMQGDSVLLYNDSNEWWVIAESLKPVGFRAHKAGANQVGLASATWVKITWPNANWNDAGLFDTANSKWTPPAGRVRLHANLQFAATNLVDQNIVGAAIYKNGAGIAFHQAHVSGIAQSLSVSLTAEDEPNGTDFYEVYGFKGGAGTGDVIGGETNSWFMGEVLKR